MSELFPDLPDVARPDKPVKANGLYAAVPGSGPANETCGKFGNVPTIVGEQRFDSKREAKRHAELELLQRAGQIEKLERQVTFPLVVQGVKIGSVRPDWTYIEGGKVIAEDSKGHATDVWKLRWKLAKALWPQIEWRVT